MRAVIQAAIRQGGAGADTLFVSATTTSLRGPRGNAELAERFVGCERRRSSSGQPPFGRPDAPLKIYGTLPKAGHGGLGGLTGPWVTVLLGTGRVDGGGGEAGAVVDHGKQTITPGGTQASGVPARDAAEPDPAAASDTPATSTAAARRT